MAVATNGTEPVPADALATDAEAIDATTGVVVNGLKALATAQAERIDRLTAELADARHQLKAYGSALGALTGERPEPAKRGRPPMTAKPKRSNVPEHIVDRIERWIYETHADDDSEFQQIEMTKALGLTSGVASLAFGVLREREIIRISSQGPGSRKRYRLTRSALANINGDE